MIRATWNGATLAECDESVVVEGNHYFPLDAVRWEYLHDSPTHTRCAWKGTASYYTVVVDGKENRDAAWYYPDPSRAAARIAGRVAFWHGVRVERVGEDGAPEKRPLLARLAPPAPTTGPGSTSCSHQSAA
jgi:uncharacterized protein (DUF427 family)